jgi:hypothetical protein
MKNLFHGYERPLKLNPYSVGNYGTILQLVITKQSIGKQLDAEIKKISKEISDDC